MSGAVHAVSATKENILLERRIISEIAGTRLLSERRILRVPHDGAVDMSGAPIRALVLGKGETRSFTLEISVCGKEGA